MYYIITTLKMYYAITIHIMLLLFIITIITNGRTVHLYGVGSE